MLDGENNPKASENIFSIQEIGDSGLGMVATAKILTGDIIVRETPVLVIPAEVKDARYSWQEKVEYLENTVAQLSKDEKNEYFKLHDCKCLPGSEKSAEGIFRTNNFALGPLTPHTAHGVFLKTSRLNHSCHPNSEVIWKADSECQEVIAIRDIEEGEEMTICYLNMENRMKTARERKKILRQYGFSCSCKFCTGEEDEEGMRRFQEMSRMLGGQSDAEEMVRLCLERENILEQVGAKLVWRISNLEMAAGACQKRLESGDDLCDKVGGKLKYLVNILHGYSLK